jgi:hypothetical protein
VIKSTRPKPLTTGQLHQGQVTFADYLLDTVRTRPPAKKCDPKTQDWGIKKTPDVTNVTNNYYDTSPPPSPPTTQVPSGGGSSGSGKIRKTVSCNTGCGSMCGPNLCPGGKCQRLQYGVENGSDEVDFNVTIKIPEDYCANDTATLQVGGSSHHSGCDATGYKGEIGINGGKNGFQLESGTEKLYSDVFGQCYNIGNLKPGQT